MEVNDLQTDQTLHSKGWGMQYSMGEIPYYLSITLRKVLRLAIIIILWGILDIGV